MMHVQTKAPVPGCPTAEVAIPKKCGPRSYVRVLDDRTEVVCELTLFVGGKARAAEQVLVYRCKNQTEKEEK